MEKSLITQVGEAIDRYRAERRATLSERTTPQPAPTRSRIIHWFLPTPGNVLFTFLIVAGLFWAQSAGALPQSLIPSLQSSSSTGTIAYQGRLADGDGNPITDTVNMEFRLYDAPAGGAPLWEELWTGSNAVRISDGLFNVMLGSLNAIPESIIASHDQLWLGITVGTDDEMSPRVQLGSVPFAVQALTVPDKSITSKKFNPTRGMTYASQHMNLTDEYQDIPGTSVTLNLDSPQTVLVIAHFDIRVPSSAQDANGRLVIDGAGAHGRAFVDSSGDTDRQTVSQIYLRNLDAGTHVLKLQAAVNGGSGGTVYRNETRLFYLAMSR